MSNIDKQALREAAEKATSGKWERGDGNGNGGELLVYCDDALGSAVCEMTSEYNAIPKYQRINNLNFIAAANPATVLALLDELEAKEKRIAEQVEIIANQEKWIKAVEETMITATDRAEAAEKRIAELSASHGKLREAMAGIHNTIAGGGAYTPMAAILNASKRAYEESAAAAGKGE